MTSLRSPSSDAVTMKILTYLREKWVEPGLEIGLETDLFEDGVIDSIGVLTLVRYLEDEFEIEIAPEDLVLENFVTISAIGLLVARIAHRQ